MFCPSCGAQTREGLRYCNRCGANLIEAKTAPPGLFKFTAVLSATIAVVAIIGFTVIFFFGIEVMSRGGVSGEIFLFLIVLSLVVLTILALLIRQLSRLLTVYLETGGASGESKTKPKLSEEQIKPLPAASEEDLISTEVFSTGVTNKSLEKNTRRIETGDLTRKLGENE